MWKCPGNCSLVYTNPEAHWKHLKEAPVCLSMTLNPDLVGWQGDDLDGPPRIVYKAAIDIPKALWNSPKSEEEQKAFERTWTLNLNANSK